MGCFTCIVVNSRYLFPTLPIHVVHADWSTSAKKRWLARAELVEQIYLVHSPELVGDLSTFLHQLADRAGKASCLLIGFDFPIGLPNTYAQRAGFPDFISGLSLFGKHRWSGFYDPAETADQISLYRPFYPYRPGGTLRQHLIDGLGMESFDQLLRTCDKTPPLQRTAAPLFWTLGAQQVGKAAINGWKYVLAPGLQDPELDLSIWPFSGKLADLVGRGRIIAVESYPAEAFKQLDLLGAQQRFSKRQQGDRKFISQNLFQHASISGIRLESELEQEIRNGFGNQASGEDRFDALIGLLGMLKILDKEIDFTEPKMESVRRTEGWIFGLSSEQVIV